MTFSYDDDADVLYVTFEDYKGRATYIENTGGDILRVHPESGKILGVTIPFFLKRSAHGEINVPEVGMVPFNTIMSSLIEERRKHGQNR
jgi:uncharacterized protein YuzE